MSMSEETRNQMLSILANVDEMRLKESALLEEKKRHKDQISQSEADLKRTEDDIDQCREAALALRRQMDDLKNEIFARTTGEDEAIVMDNSHVVTDGENPSTESERHHAWKDRQKAMRSV